MVGDVDHEAQMTNEQLEGIAEELVTMADTLEAVRRSLNYGCKLISGLLIVVSAGLILWSLLVVFP